VFFAVFASRLHAGGPGGDTPALAEQDAMWGDRYWRSSWDSGAERRIVFDSTLAIVVGLTLFSAIVLLALVRGIGSVIAESAAAKAEATVLVTGNYVPLEREKKTTGLKRHGVGLRFKLASFTIVLVLLVVVIVAAPLYYMMIDTKRETLLRGLWDRSIVLLDGLASNARAYLSAGNALELSLLPAQIAAIPEARYVTITGKRAGSAVYRDCVWATNDPDILNKIDTEELEPGVSLLTDVLSPRISIISRELEDEALLEVGHISRSIAGLNREADILSLRSDTESIAQLKVNRLSVQSMERTLTQTLARLAQRVGSEPSFSTKYFSAGSREFIFFKPVMYNYGTDSDYFRGLIRLEVSVDSIVTEIISGELLLLRTILVIALAALALGTIGALTLSSLIIRPIRKLVRYVEIIRDTEDRSSLSGMDIQIASRDEIAVLGNTINDMTSGLVKAAAAASDLSIGREVQKKFLPLELDRDGNKLTSGYKNTRNAQFFGYYEGAKGISGDYFDYQDLDGRYYAIIKCDVAGKGVPAALIMIQVATMFLNYFKQWRPGAEGMHIEEVVYQINGFIETLGFKGRFAAFTLCLFDTATGDLHFCNAGDNVVHLFDASESRIKTVILPETPATGVLPNTLVASKGGYQVQTLKLDHGDMLLLYTDGIEEAKRVFRDAVFNETLCAEGPDGAPHENHVSGQGSEELGPDRVEAIINAVMNRRIYTLHKWHNPEGSRDLQFDFSACEGRVEEVIMALISIEKMFRCYRDPRAGKDIRVLVDKKIDAFLRAHFLQYRYYCTGTREYSGNDAYLYYTHVREDEQYDDLAILGIKWK
jgi:hypothetical protein